MHPGPSRHTRQVCSYLEMLSVLVICYVLTVPSVSGFILRNRSVEFQTPNNAGHIIGRGLLSDETTYPLVFVNTQTDPIKGEDGLIEIVSQDIYLVRTGSLAYDRLKFNASYAPLLPEYKYNDALLNQTSLLISTLVPIAHPRCQVEQFSANNLPVLDDQGFYESKVYLVAHCDTTGIAKEIALNPYVIMIDSPRIKMVPLSFSDSFMKEHVSGTLLVEYGQDRPTHRTETRESRSPLTDDDDYGNDIDQATNTIICISDTGLDVTHGAFPHHTETRIIPGYTDNISVTGSHGTYTTGLAIGTTCNDGAHKYSGGVSKGSSFIFADISPKNGNPETLIVPSNFFDVILTEEIDIHSASWGADDYGEYSMLSAFFDSNSYSDPNRTHFVAVGNDGRGKRGGTPSTAKSVLSTGALDEDIDDVAWFTSDGDLPDGRRSPLIYAPGQSVIGPYGAYYPPGGTEGHCETVKSSGTSAATPMAAALAQLEIEKRKIKYGLSKIPATLIKAIMLVRLQGPGSKNAFVNAGLGNTPATSSTTGDVARGVELPEPLRVWYKCFQRTDQVMQFALAWNDPPAMPYTRYPLINDLDVMILHSKGMIVGADGVHSHEMLSFETESAFRVVVYAYGNRTIYPPVQFSAFIDVPLVEIAEAENITNPIGEECGSCMPGDISTEGCEDEDEFRQCLPLGTYTNCSSCEPGYLPTGLDGACECSTSLFVRQANTGKLYQLCRPPARIVDNTGDNLDVSEHDRLVGLVPYVAVLILFL